MPIGIGLGMGPTFGGKGTPPADAVATNIDLSASSVASNALAGSLVAYIYSDGYPQPTFTEQADPDNKFTVSGNQLLLSATPGAGPHSVTIRATNGSGTYDEVFAITVVAVDVTAPTITSTNTASVAENATLSKSLTADESVTWSIVGGADQARFEISGSTLRWLSNGVKNYESPDDADTNNAYVVTVRATDTSANTSDQTITVTVTDVDEVAPTITSGNTASVAENATLSHSLTANESVTWTVQGGADAAKFEISGSTLRWASNGTKDYEAPDDANTDNAYVVTVRATDTASNTTDQTITVTVTDVAEGGGDWWDDAAYDDMAVVADFNNDRYAITTQLIGDIPTASVSDLKVKREATFDEVFAYTAASTTARTYIDNAGVMKNDLAVNARRMTYANAKQQLRLENAGTNLIVRAQEFDNAGWQKTSLTVSANAVAAPDGTTTADTLTTSAAGGYTFQGPVAIAAAANTASVYVKPLSTNFFNFDIGSGSAYASVAFNLTGAGSVTQTLSSSYTSVSGEIVALANSWYRCIVKFTATTTDCYPLLQPSTTGTPTLNSNGIGTDVGSGSSCYAWGAQLEASAFVTDYIPTVAAQVTRAIETCRFSPAVEAVLQRAAGSVVVRGQLNVAVHTGTNRTIVGHDAGDLMLGVSSGGGDVYNWNGSGVLAKGIGSTTWADDPWGMSFGFDATGRVLTGNNLTPASDAGGTRTRTTIYLARDSGTANYAHGFYDFVGISPERLSNATLQALAVAA